jgi:hypothetical protein
VSCDAYAFAKFVRHYKARNGYAPLTTSPEVGLMDADVDALARNEIIALLPLVEGGPKIGIVLTDKGLRMATTERRR